MKFSLKSKIIVAALSLSVITGIPLVTFIYATKSSSTPSVHEEHDDLICLVEATRLCIKKTQLLAESFFSVKDNNSIPWFIRTLEQELSIIDTEIIGQLRKKQALRSKHSPIYMDIIDRTYELLTDLRSNVDKLVITLKENSFPANAMALVKPLQQLEAAIEPHIKNTMKKFQELHNLVMVYDANIARTIANFMTEFKEAMDKQPAKAQALKGLMHRVKCNK